MSRGKQSLDANMFSKDTTRVDKFPTFLSQTFCVKNDVFLIMFFLQPEAQSLALES